MDFGREAGGIVYMTFGRVFGEAGFLTYSPSEGTVTSHNIKMGVIKCFDQESNIRIQIEYTHPV